MKSLTHIAQEITKGNNLGENFEIYAKSMSTLYNSLAYIKFAMNYYTISDYLADGNCKDELFLELFERFNKITGSLCNSEYDVAEVEALRNDIIEVMETVVAFVDRLRIYEHVLNRVEYKFVEKELDENYYNSYLTNDLMHYILSDKDNVVIHNKIQTIVGQLPMRLSKSKFYEYLREAFSLYYGAKRSGVDDFVYTLRSSAMLDEPESFNKYYPQMKEICDTLANADYVSLDEAEYRRLAGALKIGSDMMNQASDIFVMLAQLVNDLYTIMITEEYSLGDVTETVAALKIINAVYNSVTSDEKLSDDILEEFVAFEGVQEKLFAEISKNDYIIEESASVRQEELDKNGQTEAYAVLRKAVKLQSGSDFVSLSETEMNDDADDAYVDAAVDKLIDEFSKLFESSSQPVKRAVMANVLSQLPVFFNNTQQIQEYINVSLIQCSDIAEKKAVIDVFGQILSEE